MQTSEWEGISRPASPRGLCVPGNDSEAGQRDTLNLAELPPFQARPGSISLPRSGFFRRADSKPCLFEKVLVLLMLMMATMISREGRP